MLEDSFKQNGSYSEKEASFEEGIIVLSKLGSNSVELAQHLLSLKKQHPSSIVLLTALLNNCATAVNDTSKA